MRTLEPFRPLLAAVAIAACSSGLPPKAPATLKQAPASALSSCAFGVKDAVASSEEREGGVALTVVTRDSLPELRARMRSSAEMRGPGSHQGPGHEGSHGSGGRHGLQAMQLPPVRTSVEDVDQGARVLLTAVDAADVARLRATVRDRIREMNSGCD